MLLPHLESLELALDLHDGEHISHDLAGVVVVSQPVDYRHLQTRRCGSKLMSWLVTGNCTGECAKGVVVSEPFDHRHLHRGRRPIQSEA
jgi:hypothetical protein